MKTSLCLLSAVFLFALSSCSKDDKKPDSVKPVASFSSDVKTLIPGGKVNFKDTSTNSPTFWTWTFEGGTPHSSSVQNPDNIVYATAGTYKVSLVAGNAAGSSELVEVQNNIIVTPNIVKPVAGFKSDVTTIIGGSKVSFTDTSTNSPTSWTWTFEGGTPGSSTTQNPDIVYATAGTYKVSLVAANSAGKSEPMEIQKYITVTTDPNSILPKKVVYTGYSGSSDNYTATFNYDNGNKITRISRGRNNIYSFGYSRSGNKITNVTKSYNNVGNYNSFSSSTTSSSTTYYNYYVNNDLRDYRTDSSSSINYSYDNPDGTISVAYGYSRYGNTINSSDFTLDANGNIIKVVYDNEEVLTIEYDTKNNPYKNISGYSSLLLTKYDISESDRNGNRITVPHSINAFDQDAYSINNIANEEKKDKNGNIISKTTFKNTYDANNFLIKTVVESNPAKDTDGTYEYTY